MKYQSSKNRSKFVREKGTFLQSGHNLSLMVSSLIIAVGVWKTNNIFKMFYFPPSIDFIVYREFHLVLF